MAKHNTQFFPSLSKHKLLSILLAACLTVLALMALARFPLSQATVSITIPEKNCTYDLTEQSDWNPSVARLLPSDIYYPNRYLMPKDADAAQSTPIATHGQIRADYLSQRFILLLPDDAVYTLTFRLSGHHAMRVYANGALVGQTGRLGTIKQDTEVYENNITVNAAAKDGKLDIILQSAQFYHAKRGASLAELQVSQAGTVADPFYANRIIGLLIMGALLCASALLVSIYLMLSRTKATLYFALACIVMALRECLQSQAWTYFPIHGNLSFQLEYLSVVLLTLFLSLYLGQYAIDNFLRSVQAAAILGSTVYGLCVLLGDSLLYTSVLLYYQLFLVLCIVPGIGGLLYRMRQPTTEQSAALYGMAVFFLAAVSDLVMYSDIFGDKTNLPISEGAMLIFVLAQTVSLLWMNNRILAETKAAEQRLATEKLALESLDRMKTEFLGNVSHELKTPLTVMSGYAQTTKQLSVHISIPQTEEISRRMTLISSEAERLSLMVSQILDMTRMEEGRMVMEPVHCHLDEIIHAAVRTHYPMLNKNQNRLKIQIEHGLPSICADPTRISQVIVNLISNAVRFTSEGEILISAEQKEQELLVCVSDSGSGIAAERIPHLFERYNKKEKSGSGQDTGTGLGLYICKHIIEQHGGRIWLESQEENGTSVFFTLLLATNTESY